MSILVLCPGILHPRDAKQIAWRQIRKWKRIYQTGFKRRQSREEIAGFGLKETREASAEYAAELEKYAQYRYNDNETIVVTDDWTGRKHPHLPPTYKSFAVVDTVSQRGRQRDRTYYDSAGLQIRQVSNGPHSNPKQHPYGEKGEHAHDILWEDGKIVGRPVRELTDDERKENADIL